MLPVQARRGVLFCGIWFGKGGIMLPVQARRGVLFCGIWFGKGGIMLPVQAVAAPPVGSIIIPKNFCETMFFL